MPFSHNQALMPSVSEGLLRFWDSMKIKMRGEFMGITLILLDENYCKEQVHTDLSYPLIFLPIDIPHQWFFKWSLQTNRAYYDTLQAFHVSTSTS
ncbi:hypothetical protein F2Q69_00025946 [Brassica cretica]|uniref:Uncharacterized protein n=1 Tax=Brassica cretica TaxID=69181 RepID=A0A8S9S6U7_BRACR|nr:hypothetical protein F2Q69_00025946 [Brassica cretica]